MRYTILLTAILAVLVADVSCAKTAVKHTSKRQLKQATRSDIMKRSALHPNRITGARGSDPSAKPCNTNCPSMYDSYPLVYQGNYAIGSDNRVFCEYGPSGTYTISAHTTRLMDQK